MFENDEVAHYSGERTRLEDFIFIYFFNKFILFLAVSGLCCCAWAFL